MRALRVVAFAGASLLTLLACNALISVPEPSDAVDGGADASASADASAFGDAGVADVIDRADASVIPEAGRDAGEDALPTADTGSDAQTCSGAPVDLSRDPKNCGSCGHDCLGGACASGECAPIVLAYNAAGALGIALDDTNVYFTQYNAGCVSKVPKAGGTVALMSAGRGHPWLITSDGKNVYWTDRTGFVNFAATTSQVENDGGAFAQCNMLGGIGPDGGISDASTGTEDAGAEDGGLVLGDVQTLAVVSASDDPYGIATDGVAVYWTQLGTGGVWSAPIAGAHPTTSELVSMGLCNGVYCETGVALSGSKLAWLTYTGFVYATPVATTTEGSTASGPTAQLTRRYNLDARFVAAYGTDVYWTMSDNNSVWTVPLAGGETVEISGSESGPWGIAADSSGVYWASSDAVRRGRRADGGWSVVTLADGLGDAIGVATDPTAVYWIENKSGRVMKIAK